MAKMNCSNNTYYKDGKCCDRCSAGTYVQADCDGSKPTKCAKCEHGRYTATKNHLNKCQICSVCSSHNKQKKAYSCTATQNTVCDCETGFYCSNVQCDHCLPLTKCIEGEGVKLPAGRTNDTICAPCEKGTYSNKTDFFSTCEKHTRCEDLGRELKSEGTSTKNAVCSDVLPRCSWMLPAALWSGLVLTALILFAVVICRRAKRKSYRAAKSKVPVTMVNMVPAALGKSMELPLPSTELNGHCQESCPVGDCKSPLFNPDDDEDNLVSCSVDSSLPITPFKASVSFAESNHTIRSAGYRTGSFLRTYSEPQEDEWCGT
ncbi:tumor necrosis factor receptor superfamily member 5-like [Seriola lalandi dorsalis]|uniref:tumor necrosis factor receptor superfamily member 5-like n=1 Tax=Seriola lalandi dorsalis TaxID=1841481 RepID=UPI000C6F7A5F|nr:tumor necrosis factor receptor superfamily member 5-like [Seriola lalandi dorsalis]XP_056236298.1 tumor necrosis factor receptor superfamily member 5 [Seriola aureovittata]